jgi:acyl transferase domain-containing protein/acyl carrier protein
MRPVVESIAVVGMQGRFPGARSIGELWENLKNGVESITGFSESELRAAGIDPAYINVPGYVNRGCVINDIELFDAGFFGYSARDAETMDPQQRVFLEMAWECLEEAGYDSETYPGAIGVFVGSDQSTYLYQIVNSVDLSAYGYGGMMSIGNEKDYVATQVSYKLNLHGPSMAVQTSCSTSLTAVCMACQTLMCGGCDMALAGGVAIAVPQRRGYWYQLGGIHSPDGHCRPFDALGQGTVVGSGVGVVLLKRLRDAIADGDRIHAVIKGFGLNNDGSAKVGYTAPSVEGQAQAIRMAQRMAGVEPETIGFVEAHGTATALGDPIEIGALTKAFRERTRKKQFCAVGSLKSNVGHLSSAAGVSGLIKAVLSIKHGQVPKNLHYEQPNPQIDFKNTPFFVASELMDWPLPAHPRRAAVSSFGVGGTNAHVVLEEAPEIEADAEAPQKQLLLLSARNPQALDRMTARLAECVNQSPEFDLADVAYTLQVGRRLFPHRRAMVFDRFDRTGFVSALRNLDPARVLTSCSEARDRAVVFMFSGQGTQYVDMGLELYETEKTFREHLDTCSAILKSEMNLDIRDLLYPTRDRESAAERLKQTSITQPALFAIEYSLAQLWMEWGLAPRAMVGHSIGEYVAACLAGVMGVKDALSVVAMRGRLMESMEGGSMLAVSLPESALQPLLNPRLSLAAVNAPTLCVLSGQTPAIEAVERQFIDQGLMCRRLQTSHAFHSAMMEPVVKQFVERLTRIALKPPQLAYLSNVTGTWIKPELATSPHYWGAHLRQTVRFGDNLRELMVFPDLALVEVGPGQTLGFLARQQGSRASSQLIVQSLRSPQEEAPDSELIRNSVAKLWMGGVRFNWHGYHAHERRRRVPLPTYPFERQRFWLGPLEEEGKDNTGAQAVTSPTAADMPTLAETPAWSSATSSGPAAPTSVSAARDVADWFYVPAWKPAIAAHRSQKTETGSALLLFADGFGIGEAIREQLRSSNRPVNMVVRGEEFTAEDDCFVVRAGERNDYDALLKMLRERNQSPGWILHLWSIDEPEAEGIPAFDQAQQRSFYSLVYLAQALGKSGAGAQVQIGVVTDQLQAVTGGEKLRSYENTVAGACKVINQEYPSVRCRLIDVDRSQTGLASSLVNEINREAFEAVVAYRNGRRWLQRYEPVQLGPPQQKIDLLRDDGVYLITGGLGNIGLVLAEAIAKQVRAKLVLTGRSPFPDRAKWDEIASSRTQDQTGARVRKLMALEKMGAQVMVSRADAADQVQMQRVIEQVEQKWGRIHGVIHGAANLAPDAFGPLKDMDAGQAAGQFRPKAHGLLILETVLQSRPPDFYVLLSSLSAVLGGLGLAAYASSNAFLDAEAQRRNGTGTTAWITTNWDAWDFAPGAGARSDAVSATRGSDAFIRILASGLPQVVVSTTPLERRLENWINLAEPAPATAAAAGQTAGPAGSAGVSHSRPELSTQFVAPRTDAEKAITGVWEHLLGVEPIGVYDKFFELGGHSLLAIQLLARLREIFDLDFPVQRIFEAPTVAQLAESIERDRQSSGSSNGNLQQIGDKPEDENIEEMLRLVEGLSESELDALLSEAEAVQNKKEPHV